MTIISQYLLSASWWQSRRRSWDEHSVLRHHRHVNLWQVVVNVRHDFGTRGTEHWRVLWDKVWIHMRWDHGHHRSNHERRSSGGKWLVRMHWRLLLVVHWIVHRLVTRIHFLYLIREIRVMAVEIAHSVHRLRVALSVIVVMQDWTLLLFRECWMTSFALRNLFLSRHQSHFPKREDVGIFFFDLKTSQNRLFLGIRKWNWKVNKS